MKTVIDLSVPKSWQELTKQRVQSQVDLNSAESRRKKRKSQLPDKELRYVFRLLNGSFTITQVKARCLLRWAGMRVLRQ
ncbi:MAG: hypothetical protein IKP36_01295 [Bacteroidaceae bacterium]|nr:hypothetical protein [Bacteroidaceae bacterium]